MNWRACRAFFLFTLRILDRLPLPALNASHAARCVACQGVGSHPVPVALVGECSIPVVHHRLASATTLAPSGSGSLSRSCSLRRTLPLGPCVPLQAEALDWGCEDAAALL